MCKGCFYILRNPNFIRTLLVIVLHSKYDCGMRTSSINSIENKILLIKVFKIFGKRMRMIVNRINCASKCNNNELKQNMSANEMNSSEDEVILRVNLPEVDFEAEVEDLRGSGSDDKSIEERVTDYLNMTSVPLTK